MCSFVYNLATFIYISLIRWRVSHNNVHEDTRESLKMKQEACWYLVMILLDVCVCVI